MKAHQFQTLAAILILAILASACSFSTANITSAKMTVGGEGTQETTVFAPDQTFYCIVELANAPDDTRLKAVWTAVQVEGEAPNLLLDETEIITGDGNVITFKATNQGLWPVGKYKVDLYLNDALDRTLNFEVQ